MKAQYEGWILGYYMKHEGKILGRCQDAVKLMKEAFPELTAVKGHVLTTWGMRAHWWLIDEEAKETVDPTVGQFQAVFSYEPWRPGDEVQVGKCMNCGEEIWEAVQSLDGEYPHKSICSDKCNAEMLEYVNGETRSASSVR